MKTDRTLAWLGCLLVFSAAAFVLGLADAPIERAEIYFLDAGRAMVETGDWLVPHYRGEPFYDKPPLTYWLLALSFEAFGPGLFAGRLVAALLALATLWITFTLTARLLAPPASDRGSFEERWTAYYATAILGTSYAFVSFARLTMSDMLLTLLTLLAGGMLILSEVESRHSFLVPCGALLGLGFLAKGPIAWIYFGSLFAALLLVERRAPRVFNRSGLAGAVLATLLGLGWFVLVYSREGIEPLKWFFLRENLQRFAAPTYDTAEPFWFYLPVYAVEGLPWSVLALPAIVHALKSESPRLLRILLFWAAIMLIPLALSRGKIDYYLLPVLPPMSMLIAGYLGFGRPRAWTLRALALVMAGLLAGAFFFPMLPPPFAPSAGVVQGMRVFFGLAAAACLISAFRPKARTIVTLCAGAVLGAALFLFGAIVPAYRAAQPTQAFLDDIARERVFTPDLEVAVCDDTLRLQRDLLFTLRIPVVEQCELWAVVSSSRKFLILVTAAQEKSLRSAEQVRHIATRDHLPADLTRIGTLLAGVDTAPLGLLANFKTTDPVARWKENREWKRWLDTPEGQKAQAEYEEKQRQKAAERNR